VTSSGSVPVGLPAASSVIFSTRADRLLERHLAFLEPLDDRFEFLDRPLEGEALDVGMGVVGHGAIR